MENEHLKTRLGGGECVDAPTCVLAMMRKLYAFKMDGAASGAHKSAVAGDAKKLQRRGDARQKLIAPVGPPSMSVE